MNPRTLTTLLIVVAIYLALTLSTETIDPFQALVRLAAEGGELVAGTRLTHAAKDDAGDVTSTPQALADEAAATLGQAVSIEEYALARMLRCERTSARRGGNDAEGAAIVWVALNDAAANNGGDILACLTGGHGFGHQGSLRKYATNNNDPLDTDLALVRRCLSGEIPDPTGGATHFMHRTGFKTPDLYAAAVARWQDRGWRNFGIDVGTSLEIWT